MKKIILIFVLFIAGLYGKRKSNLIKTMSSTILI